MSSPSVLNDFVNVSSPVHRHITHTRQSRQFSQSNERNFLPWRIRKEIGSKRDKSQELHIQTINARSRACSRIFLSDVRRSIYNNVSIQSTLINAGVTTNACYYHERDNPRTNHHVP